VGPEPGRARTPWFFLLHPRCLPSGTSLRLLPSLLLHHGTRCCSASELPTCSPLTLARPMSARAERRALTYVSLSVMGPTRCRQPASRRSQPSRWRPSATRTALAKVVATTMTQTRHDVRRAGHCSKGSVRAGGRRIDTPTRCSSVCPHGSSMALPPIPPWPSLWPCQRRRQGRRPGQVPPRAPSKMSSSPSGRTGNGAMPTRRQ